MKFLIFSDLHRSPNFDAGTYEDLKIFEERAKLAVIFPGALFVA